MDMSQQHGSCLKYKYGHLDHVGVFVQSPGRWMKYLDTAFAEVFYKSLLKPL
jgi:hypothetical protein